MTTQIKVIRTLTQQEFNDFAALSGDNNPIHVDPAFAAGTRFGATVAHGLFLTTVLRGLADKLVPGGVQKSQSVVFPAPTYTGRPIAFFAEIIKKNAEDLTLVMSATDTTTDKETCIIETHVEQMEKM